MVSPTLCRLLFHPIQVLALPGSLVSLVSILSRPGVSLLFHPAIKFPAESRLDIHHARIPALLFISKRSWAV